MTHLKRQNYFVKIEKNKYDLEPYAEKSSAAYCKVVFVIFLSQQSKNKKLSQTDRASAAHTIR